MRSRAKNKGRRNPLSVRKGYSKRASLQRSLTSHYETCLSSSTAQRFKGQRRKRYCAGVAWKIAKRTPRYRNYPGFKETGHMAKSRKKSRIARRRLRSTKGRFVKAAARTTTASAKSPTRRRTRRHHRARAAAPAQARTRVRHRRAAARTTTAAAPRRRRRARAADWRGQPRRHRKASRKGWTRRRRHVSGYASPHKRRGRKRFSRAHETTAAATPRRHHRRRRASARTWPDSHSRHVRAAKKGWRHRRSAEATSANPRPRRRPRKRARARARDWRGQPRRHARAARLGWSRRRRAGRVHPRRAHAKRSHAKRSHAKRHTRRSPRSTRSSRAVTRRYHRSPETLRGIGAGPETMRSGSGEGYVLSNPLSAGELVLVGITGILGYGLADFVGRYMTTTAVPANSSTNAIPTGAVYSNDVATSTWPSWQAMAAQAAIAVVPGVAAAFVDSPWGRAALQGMMLGAGFSLFGGIFKSLMASMLSGSTLGQQLYAVEIEAQLIGNPWTAGTATAGAGGTFCQAGTAAAQAAPSQQVAAPSATTTATGTTGLPRGVGARPGLRYPHDVGPRALPGRGMGQALPGTVPGTAVPSTTMAPPSMTMVPVTPAPVPSTQAPPSLTPNPPAANPSPGGPARRAPANASGRAPCNDAFSPIPQPGYSHPATPFEGGVLTNTGDVARMPPAGTATPGGPTTGPHQGGAGHLAQVQDLAERAIRDESCLGNLPGGVLYGAFHDDQDAA